MPSQAELEQHGLDEDDIREVEASFLPKKRERFLQTDRSELEKLVYEYDCSVVEVGLVTFHQQPETCPEGQEVGCYDANPLVVLEDGCVVVLDMTDRTRVLYVCSADSSGFLEGLLKYALLIKEKDSWIGKGDEAARLCSESAGGDDFFQFWRDACVFSESGLYE